MISPALNIDESEAAQLRSDQQAYIFPCVRTLYVTPLVLREARGCWVTDSDGVEHLDLFAGILSTALGH
jgi:4-aminobutyrate aminotransferase-like enzyme